MPAVCRSVAVGVVFGGLVFSIGAVWCCWVVRCDLSARSVSPPVPEQWLAAPPPHPPVFCPDSVRFGRSPSLIYLVGICHASSYLPLVLLARIWWDVSESWA